MEQNETNQKIELTKEQALEYDLLRRNNRFEEIHASLSTITDLEHDIDEPIKNCVMALALLGCHPIWSCCGFDYKDQLLHKVHNLGQPYIMCEYSEKLMDILYKFYLKDPGFAHVWNSGMLVIDNIRAINIVTNIQRGGAWGPSTIHFNELGATYIKHLEDYLISLKARFVDTTILVDTNALYKKRFPAWQYPPKKDWVITRQALMKRVLDI